MAAEAKEAGVESVTMVHSKDFVTNTPQQGKIPLERLKKIGVNVILNSKAELVEDKTYQIGAEQKSFDVVFKCFGFKTLHGELVMPLGNVLTSSGAIDVNESFQVCPDVCCVTCSVIRKGMASTCTRSVYTCTLCSGP